MPRVRGVAVAAVIVALILALQMVVQVVGAYIADQGAHAAARDTYTYVGDLMAEKVYGMADAGTDVVEGTASEITRAGTLASGADLTAALAARLDREDMVGSIFVGRPDGHTIALARDPEGDGYIRTDVAPGVSPVATRETLDAELAVIDSVTVETDYDVTGRPWYRLAVDSNEPVWTRPYVSLRTGELVVSPVVAARVDGDVLAVVGADLDIDRASDLLDDIPIGADARAFVLTADDRRVIAAPRGARDELAERVEDLGTAPPADELGLRPVASDTHAAEGTVAAGDIAFDDDSDLVRLERSIDADGLDWILHLEARETDLTPGLNRFTEVALLVTAFSILMVVLAAIFAARLWRPLLRLRDRASTDPLTGLANRYEFSQRAGAIARVAQADDHALLVVTFDLDRFKRLNDSAGHDAGDAVLAAVGQALLESVRRRDVAARLGGDEFIAVLRVRDAGAARDVASRLRRDVESAIRGCGAWADEVGVTAGFATSAVHGHDIPTLQRAADAALVAGKRKAKGHAYGDAGEPGDDARVAGERGLTRGEASVTDGAGRPLAEDRRGR